MTKASYPGPRKGIHLGDYSNCQTILDLKKYAYRSRIWTGYVEDIDMELPYYERRM